MKEIINLINTVIHKPWAIFVVFTFVFGYLYIMQNEEITELSSQVAAHRVELSKMNEIIRLKSEISILSCEVKL